MAGYDPNVAVAFWQRMAQATGNSYSILSDHPSDATRIKNIQGWLPEALKYYKPASRPSANTTTKTFHVSTSNTKKTTSSKKTTTSKKSTSTKKK